MPINYHADCLVLVWGYSIQNNYKIIRLFNILGQCSGNTCEGVYFLWKLYSADL